MRARKRGHAHFVVEAPSSVKGLEDVVWRVTVSETGVIARRDRDGRRVSIDWRTLLGTALYHGKEER